MIAFVWSKQSLTSESMYDCIALYGNEAAILMPYHFIKPNPWFRLLVLIGKQFLNKYVNNHGFGRI